MKKILFATVALLAVSAAVPAFGADLGARPYYNKAPAYAAPIYNWTGFYIGAHLGGAFSSDSNFNGLSTGNNGNGRFLGGLQAGADWQVNPNFVVGAEAQYSWLSGNVGAVFPGGVAYTNNQRGLGSITGRVGYTWGPGLVYVKGGYAYSDNNEKVTIGGVPAAFIITGDHSNGYTIGAASNTCSLRTGRPKPSTSTIISATRASPRVRWSAPVTSPPTTTPSRPASITASTGRARSSRATDRA